MFFNILKDEDNEIICEIEENFIDFIKIRIKNKNPLRDLREVALNTVGKKYEEKEIENEYDYYFKYFKSEHSPIRNIDLLITLENIPYYNSVHFARHVHSIPYVTTNRPDKTKKERSVNDKVIHIMAINPQGLIDMMRKRLCIKCDPITQKIATYIKSILQSSKNNLFKALGDSLVPNCVYRNKCPEFKSCKN